MDGRWEDVWTRHGQQHDSRFHSWTYEEIIFQDPVQQVQFVGETGPSYPRGMGAMSHRQGAPNEPPEEAAKEEKRGVVVGAPHAPVATLARQP